MSEMIKDKIVDILSNTNKPCISDLIMYMKVNGFFTAPCSSRYHLCKGGGLAEHSLQVYEFGLEIVKNAEIYSLDNNVAPITVESWAIASILHDLGKASYRGKPHYVPNELASGKVSTLKPYVTNKDRLYISHEIVSLQIASKFIDLTEEEEFAILYHNGLYVSSGEQLNGKERPLQTLLHFADMWSSRFLESK